MHIFITVDDAWGTRFNNRRQSRDKAVTARMVELSAGARLWIHESSAKLFPSPPENLIADNGFTVKAAAGDFCFVEDMSLLPDEEQIEDMIVFHWNRHYPSDQVFDRQILENGWKITGTFEFAGNSHETITEEWYKRKTEKS